MKIWWGNNSTKTKVEVGTKASGNIIVVDVMGNTMEMVSGRCNNSRLRYNGLSFLYFRNIFLYPQHLGTVVTPSYPTDYCRYHTLP